MKAKVTPPFAGRPSKPKQKSHAPEQHRGGIPPQPQVKPTQSALVVECALTTADNLVIVSNGAIRIMLKCNGSLHAKLIAQAISDGAVDIDSEPDCD